MSHDTGEDWWNEIVRDLERQRREAEAASGGWEVPTDRLDAIHFEGATFRLWATPCLSYRDIERIVREALRKGSNE